MRILQRRRRHYFELAYLEWWIVFFLDRLHWLGFVLWYRYLLAHLMLRLKIVEYNENTLPMRQQPKKINYFMQKLFKAINVLYIWPSGKTVAPSYPSNSNDVLQKA